MNKLGSEVSPYLLQHKNNPVHWEPWGPEALERAKKEDKPILVSIGYAACHWCHVMEHESFENEEVASLMNAHFINIKVDREERPDVDMVYMEALHQMGLTGGWPLNVFLLPDQKPFYGGTYFKKDNWIQLLYSIHNAFINNREELAKSAAGFAESLSENASFFAHSDLAETAPVIPAALAKIKSALDPIFGGINKAPKFPLPSLIQFLYSVPSGLSIELGLPVLQKTWLEKMAQGGIYDAVGGGFSRYSVDSEWFCPHFEKMLYDNAQLLSAYTKAYKRERNPLYQEVVFDTISFLKRELLSPRGLYYSSLDADSEGEEGLFYTWSFSELAALNNEEFLKTYSISKNGNWEDGRNILFKSSPVLNAYFEKEMDALRTARLTRIRPGTDTKEVLVWNAQLVMAFVEVYQVFGRKEDLQSALDLIEAIEKHLKNGDLWLHQAEYSREPIGAFLDDVSAMVLAYVHVYLLSSDSVYREKADNLLQMICEDFAHPALALYQYRSKKADYLIAEKVEVMDSVMPSSNSMLCEAFLWMGILKNKADYTLKGRAMLSQILERAIAHPAYFANWLRIYSEWMEHPKALLKFAGNGEGISSFDWCIDKDQLVFIPSDEIEAYLLCVGDYCFAPVATLLEVDKQLAELI
ncbi:MAG: hypothetical protein RL045_478 [Bacteroidota bacterium]|jgi:uncharacterized protein YyaL (SSP411 family)